MGTLATYLFLLWDLTSSPRFFHSLVLHALFFSFLRVSLQLVHAPQGPFQGPLHAPLLCTVAQRIQRLPEQLFIQTICLATSSFAITLSQSPSQKISFFLSLHCDPLFTFCFPWRVEQLYFSFVCPVGCTVLRRSFFFSSYFRILGYTHLNLDHTHSSSGSLSPRWFKCWWYTFVNFDFSFFEITSSLSCLNLTLLG